MRELKEFGKRSVVLKSNQPKIKYLLLFEGEETELIYFNSVNNLRNDIGIHP